MWETGYSSIQGQSDICMTLKKYKYMSNLPDGLSELEGHLPVQSSEQA
jgi:hypothetical protein